MPIIETGVAEKGIQPRAAIQITGIVAADEKIRSTASRQPVSVVCAQQSVIAQAVVHPLVADAGVFTRSSPAPAKMASARGEPRIVSSPAPPGASAA